MSIVVSPSRRPAHAARWNGHAPHTATGAASTSETHSSCSNRNAGTIAISTTGSDRTALASSRRRSDASSTSCRSGPGGRTAATGVAAYPAAETVSRRSSVLTESG